MKPYFETKLGKLYHGDCLDIMPHLGSVDLVLTDPPYGINLKTDQRDMSKPIYGRGGGKMVYGKKYDKVYGDDLDFDPKPLFNISNNLCLFGANYFADKLPISSGWIVWDKKRPLKADQAMCELAWTNFVKGVRIFSCLWNGMIRSEKERYHPTQKPVSLMVWILNLKWTPAGIVLDPYLGSGTTAIACEELKRKWIGIEKHEKYCEIAANRIRKHNQQLSLF